MHQKLLILSYLFHMSTPHTFATAFNVPIPLSKPTLARGHICQKPKPHTLRATKPTRPHLEPHTHLHVTSMRLEDQNSEQTQYMKYELIENFLTTRAVLTEIFYRSEFGDTDSVEYLSRFKNFGQAFHSSVFLNSKEYLAELYHSCKGSTERSKLTKNIIAHRSAIAQELQLVLSKVDQLNIEILRECIENLHNPRDISLESKRQVVIESDSGSEYSPLFVPNKQDLIKLLTREATQLLIHKLKAGQQETYESFFQYANKHKTKTDTEFIKEIYLGKEKVQFERLPIVEQILHIRLLIAGQWFFYLKETPEKDADLLTNFQKSDLERIFGLD